MNLEGKDVRPVQYQGGGYHIDVCSTFASSFIERFKDRPFFFYLSYRAPHVPLDPPEKYLARFPEDMPKRRRKALAMISAMDDGVGRIMQTLRRHRIEEKTLIFFISDQGAPLMIHKYDAPGDGPGWNGSLNEPLNGEKGMLSEGGIRIPFLAYWKDTIPGGQTYDQPVISLDVAATAIELAGIDPDPILDGVNLIPYLTGRQDSAPHERLFWRWNSQAAIREGKWKYLKAGTRTYLFDIDKDKEEKRNLIEQHPEVTASLRAKLSAWAEGLTPPGIGRKGLAMRLRTYYDFYLDGKPAPPLKEKTDARRKP